MKKGSYVVQEVYESSGGGVKGGGGGGVATSAAVHSSTGAAARHPDTSYSACLLALLFFLALCIIIMLAAWPWNRGKAPPPPLEDHDEEGHAVHEGLYGDKTSTTTKVPVTKNPPTPPHEKEQSHPTPKTTTPYQHPTTTTPYQHPTTAPIKSPGEESDYDEPHHHPHHPHHPGEGHHHHPHHEKPETTTPSWEPTKTTSSHPHTGGYTKGGAGVQDGHKRPSKGLRPRIGGEDEEEEEDSSVETLTKKPGEVTKMGDEKKSERLVLDKQANDTNPTTTSTPTTTQMGEEMSTTVTTEKPSLSIVSDIDGGEEKTVDEEQKSLEVCQTSSCKSLAARMLAFMDHSADPCNNFYEYACGGMTSSGSEWISEEVSEANAWSRISDMLSHINELSPFSHQKFKSFHDSCVFYDLHVTIQERLQKAHDVLASVGRFYRDNEWKLNPGNLTSLIGNLLKHHFSPLFDVLLDVDAKSSKFSIKLTAPVMKSPFGDADGVPLNGWKSEACKQQAIRKPQNKMEVDLGKRYKKYVECNSKYEDYIEEVKHAIAALKIIKYENETVTQKLITDTAIYLDVLLNETELKVKPNPGEKRRILLAKEFETYTIREMKDKFPLIDWKILISMLLGQDIADETEIQVYFEDYFQSFFQNLINSGIEERTVNNALMAMFAHEMYHGLVVHRSSCNRKAYCLNVAKELMDPIASSLFLKSFDSVQLSAYQSKITSVYKELITTLKFEIGNLEWMDKNSQISALDKLQNLRLYADGGVSVFLNESYLEKQFEKEAVNKSYLENAVDLMRRYRERMYEVYQKNPFEAEQIWSHFLLPFREQGIVIYGLNSLVIPYGRLIKPFFSDEYPLYIQMSGLGFMIAHEIWHQFDTTGVKYDFKGHRDNKFSEAAMSAINETAKCAFHQADAPVIHVTSKGEKILLKLNPALSLNERLVDIGGVNLAYKTTWKSVSSAADVEALPWTSFTPKQLYFLSLAQNFCTKSSEYDYAVSVFEDEHLPPFKRVKDIVLNSVEFAEAFSCSVSAKNRCLPFTLRKDHVAV